MWPRRVTHNCTAACRMRSSVLSWAWQAATQPLARFHVSRNDPTVAASAIPGNGRGGGTRSALFDFWRSEFAQLYHNTARWNEYDTDTAARRIVSYCIGYGRQIHVLANPESTSHDARTGSKPTASCTCLTYVFVHSSPNGGALITGLSPRWILPAPLPWAPRCGPPHRPHPACSAHSPPRWPPPRPPG